MLREWRNSDGGWGGQSAEGSGIEYTALAVTTLFELGDGRFVPTKAACEALEKSSSEVDDLRTERDQLQAKLRSEVDSLCGDIHKDRNQLREQVEDHLSQIAKLNKRIITHESEKESLRETIQDITKELERRERRERKDGTVGIESPTLTARVDLFGRLQLLLLAFAGIFAAMAAYFLGAGYTLIVVIALSSGSVAALLSAIYSGALRSRNLRRIELLQQDVLRRQLELEALKEGAVDRPPHLGSARIDELLDSFRYVTEDYPAEVREELLYRLLREGTDLPYDLTPRFARELVADLNIPSRYSQRLEVWLERALSLDPSSRRLLFLQLRRVIL